MAVAGGMLVPAVLGGMIPGDGALAADPGGDAGRELRKEVVVKASLEDVWRCWTTSEGIESFFAPEAHVELRVGGRYELWMDKAAPEGARGTEGCHVLSYLPMEMLSFEWNFPPSIPELRDKNTHTHVVLLFDKIEPGQVRVRLAQLGWQEGEDWDRGYEYFDRAWTHVMAQLKNHFEPDMRMNGSSK